jgi:hypothetical protein
MLFSFANKRVSLKAISSLKLFLIVPKFVEKERELSSERNIILPTPPTDLKT